MFFEETYLEGAFVIKLEPIRDERGYFARTFCQKELEKHFLHTHFPQCNISYNLKKGTIRGLHYQVHPYEEVKIVTCRKGSIFDVIVDIRKASRTFGKWFAIELSADNNLGLYVPIGFAHGFQTLTDDAEVFYQMGNYYQPNSARGIRWDDNYIGITWPLAHDVIISERDTNFPNLLT